MTGALHGIRVLDLTEYVAGPYCTKLLADFGAEVIKVERPGVGDPVRNTPPFLNVDNGNTNGILFNYLNTNKRSVAVDIGTDFGKLVLSRAARHCNVIVESFSSDETALLDFDRKTLLRENPALVVTSIPMFEENSPYSHWKLSELSLYALSGLMGLVGGIGKPPIKAGGNQGQLMAGAHAAALTLFALNGALTTGKGSWIEASALASCAKIFAHMSEYTTVGADSSVAPDIRRERQSSVLPCKDGFMTVTLYYFQMEELGELLGIPGLSEDPRFSSEENLRTEENALKGEIARWLTTRTADEAQQEAQSHRLLFTKVSTSQDLLESAHLKEREYFQPVALPGAGEVMFPGAPFRFSETPMKKISPAPALGEANRDFFVDLLGFSKTELTERELV